MKPRLAQPANGNGHGVIAPLLDAPALKPEFLAWLGEATVSYTHLTLPTICSV